MNKNDIKTGDTVFFKSHKDYQKIKKGTKLTVILVLNTGVIALHNGKEYGITYDKICKA